MGSSYGIAASLRVIPTYIRPELRPTADGAFVASFSEVVAGSERSGIEGDLLSITITNGIAQPYGAFELELAVRRVMGRLTWAEIIQPYTLIAIALHRSGADAACTAYPEVVMLGLTDYARIQEDWSQAAPRRVIRIAGRSLSALLSDTRWFFHHFLNTVGAVSLPDDFRQYYASGSDERLLRDDVAVRSLGYFALDPDMYKNLRVNHPVAAMERTYDVFVGTETVPGFIKLEFNDGRSLRSRLTFDSAAAYRNFFDPNARLASQAFPSNFNGLSCWQSFRAFAEAPFVELFTDTFGTSVDDAAMTIICRKPPWAGHIGTAPTGATMEFGRAPVLGAGASPRPIRAGSLFDTAYGDWVRMQETVEIDGSDVIAIPQMSRGQDGPDAVWNIYEVVPATNAPSGDGPAAGLWARSTPPLLDEDVDSPSSLQRWGLRAAPKQYTNYVDVIGQGTSELRGGDRRRQILAYQLLLRTWFYRKPEFWHGTYVLKGRTALRAGRRLLDTDLQREYYITNVVHRMEFGADPSFTTTVQVERGWDLTPGAG